MFHKGIVCQKIRNVFLPMDVICYALSSRQSNVCLIDIYIHYSHIIQRVWYFTTETDIMESS